MGANKYLFYTAFRRDLTINKVSSKYKNFEKEIHKETKVKEDKDKKTNSNSEETEADKELDLFDEEVNTDDTNKSNYILTLTQVTQTKNKSNESMFEPISQVNIITFCLSKHIVLQCRQIKLIVLKFFRWII